MLTCKDISETATDYLEGETSFIVRLKFQFHLLFCKYCRRYYRQLKLSIATLRKLPQASDANDKPSEAEIDRILKELKDRSQN